MNKHYSSCYLPNAMASVYSAVHSGGQMGSHLKNVSFFKITWSAYPHHSEWIEYSHFCM